MARVHHTLAGLIGFCVISFVGGVGCSKTEPEPTAAPATTTTSTSTAATASTGTGTTAATPASSNTPPSGGGGGGPEDIAYEAPKAWQSMPNPNAMRKATFKVPKAPGDPEDAELTVSAAIGGVEPNIKRWSGQFANAEPKTEPRTVNGLKVTIVEIKGTFASGGMMGAPAPPKDKYMLLGAVVDGGERLHFFKMTGPEKTVMAAKKDFDAFVGTFRAK